MSDKRIFVDSNVLLYLFDANKDHSDFAKKLLMEKKYFIKAFEVSRITNFSYWDSLIVASAMENKCDILYSEDMNPQIVESVEIINPFLIT